MKCTPSVALREDSNPIAVTVSWADPQSTPFYLLDVGTNTSLYSKVTFLKELVDVFSFFVGFILNVY